MGTRSRVTQSRDHDMRQATSLKVGLVTQESILDHVLMEMLDHQGIVYETVESDKGRRYPVVLLSSHTKKATDVAKEVQMSEDSVIVVGDVVRLDEALRCLSGRLGDDDEADRLDPWVNLEEARLASAIKERLSSMGLPFVIKWFWPRLAKACCVLTHDIDWLTYSPFHKAVLDGQKNILRLSGLAARSLVRGQDYGWNIPEMVAMEKKHGVKSTYLFQTAYDDKKKHLKPSIDLLRSNGFELGLHAAHSSHKTIAALKSELDGCREMTGGYPAGVRYHILKFKVPDTWKIMAEAGLQYDATFSHNRYFGFRGEVCFPYRPFDDGRLPIVELPTSFMDWTALSRPLRGEKAAQMLARAKQTVEKYHGVLAVNFHNPYINRQTFPDMFDLYEWLLGTVTSEDYWVATASECVAWWNFRAAAVVEPRVDEAGIVVCPGAPVPLVVENEKKERIPVAV